MATILEAPGIDAVNVHEWLGRVSDGLDVALQGSSPLTTACASAVDPLEIAVALEVAGISHAVATERYNRADVFSLAGTLWSRIPLRPAPTSPVTLPRSGDRRDLARGLLYAVPAVMLLALTSAFDLSLARWVLPLAISWGWGLGQVTAFVGYRLQQREDSRHEAAMMARVVGAAALSTCLVSTIAALSLGGGATAVAAATALVTYMVASAILLVRAEERWLAGLLLPGALASLIALAVSNGSIVPRAVAVVVIGGSFLAVVCRALRHARLRSGGRPMFARRDILVASGHLLHGLLCGLSLSIVVIQVGHASPESGFARMLLPVPLLATLGVMEWQLRTYRSRVANLTYSLESAARFPRLAWHEFCRSLVICVASTTTVAGAVVIAVQVHGGQNPIGALVVECALGAVFFTDLIVVLFDRLDLVLRAWLTGLAVGCLALAGLFTLTDSHTDRAVFQSGCILVSVVLVSLLFYSRAVVSAAMNH
jgi:hypothetical protein